MPVNEHNTLFIGKVLYEFQRLESTNIRAQELIAKSKPTEGTVISATEQYAGRGQFGSLWLSAPDRNITLSVILYPEFLPPLQQFLLNQAISIGVFDFFNVYLGADVSIKWPNDIYIGDRKAGGILIQNTIMGNNLSSSIAGIGLNINQTDFPESLPNPVSWQQVTGITYDLFELKQRLFWHLETRYLQLKAGKHEILRATYQKALYRYLQTASFITEKGQFKGRITGVNQEGRLEIEDESGLMQAYGFKEVRFIT